MLLDLMKSAFSQALFLSGLEGGPTERVLEAFCEAIVFEKQIVLRLNSCLSHEEHLSELNLTDRYDDPRSSLWRRVDVPHLAC